VATILMPPAGS